MYLPGTGVNDRLFEALWLRLRVVLSRFFSQALNSACNIQARWRRPWASMGARVGSEGSRRVWHAAEWACGTHVVRVTLWRGWVWDGDDPAVLTSQGFSMALCLRSLSAKGGKVESLERATWRAMLPVPSLVAWYACHLYQCIRICS